MATGLHIHTNIGKFLVTLATIYSYVDTFSMCGRSFPGVYAKHEVKIKCEQTFRGIYMGLENEATLLTKGKKYYFLFVWQIFKQISDITLP